MTAPPGEYISGIAIGAGLFASRIDAQIQSGLDPTTYGMPVEEQDALERIARVNILGDVEPDYSREVDEPMPDANCRAHCLNESLARQPVCEYRDGACQRVGWEPRPDAE